MIFKFKHNIYLLVIVFLMGTILKAQPTKKQEFDVYTLVEEYFSELEEDNNQIDIDFLVDYLEQLRVRPINLNSASIEDLESLGLLTSSQVNAIVSYRELYGKFISIYELQVIPQVDIESIHRIRSFVSVYGSAEQFQKNVWDMMKEGRSTLFLKWKQTLEDKKGYQSIEGEPSKYLGDKNHYLARYIYDFENRLRYGFTMEKDAGETFFEGNNKNGFDYYSGFFYLKDYNKYIRSLAIGDYNVSLGQGLILNNSFGGRKSSFTTNIKKGGRIFRPYSSVSENNFNRGAAIELGLGEHTTVSGFVSIKNRDATITTDTIDGEVESFFTSLLLDGNHRTQSEIDKKDQLKQNTFGGRVKYENSTFQLSFNFLRDKFEKDLTRSDQAYNKNRFNGYELSNYSLDYSYTWKNLYFFGESAMSDNSKMAHLHGLLISPHQTTSLAVLYRDYDPEYQSLNSNSFSENSGTNDERGVYLGIEFKPYKHWYISAYADHWSHDWAKFNQAYPSKGNEYLFRLRYYRKRKFETYVQYFHEVKDISKTIDGDKFKSQITQTRQRIRWHLANKISKTLELRNRVEFSFYDIGPQSTGFLIYQDIIFKPQTLPLSVTARFALFDTDDYNSRIYAYENDILYEFYIPAYSGKGSRYYVNLKYKFLRRFTGEFRIARTYLPEVNVISSGNEQIDGNTKTEIKAQLKIRF